jgi:hypothetical protein
MRPLFAESAGTARGRVVAPSNKPLGCILITLSILLILVYISSFGGAVCESSIPSPTGFQELLNHVCDAGSCHS